MKKIINKILLIIFVIFCLILIIQLILKFAGKSPTDTQMIYIALGSITSYLLIMSYKLGEFVGEVKEFMKTSKNTFRELNEQISKKKKG